MPGKRLECCVVSKDGKKPIIGILGGICSGKSTVAGEFAKLGCKVIDADKIAHELLERKDIKYKIRGYYGEAAFDDSGKIDSRKLANIVFADTERLSLLHKIIHPLILRRAYELIDKYNGQSQVKAIVLDMPLLAEVGWDKKCDKLIFVDCKRELRIDRAKKKGIFDENQLKNREKFQISLDIKVSITDNTIDNNSGYSALPKQIADIFSCIIDK
jgi:dephospho-CoA kinase